MTSIFAFVFVLGVLIFVHELGHFLAAKAAGIYVHRFSLGMGKKCDKATMKDLPAGGYALLPAEMRHFAMAKTAAVVQVHGQGPFALNYVNPADDPSTRTPAK